MSKVCVVCGKGRMVGNLVSHSNRKTKRSFSANVHKTAIEMDGKVSREYVCTKCKKTAKKNME